MIGVSIHAPVRGATVLGANTARPTVFQSTPPYGGRPLFLSLWKQDQAFQSTPPYGGRLPKAFLLLSVACFNPRPRTGGDHASLALTLASTVSIHAPVRGATPKAFLLLSVAWFQSTPPYGGDHVIPLYPSLKNSFNPRPRTGGDLKLKEP